MNPADAIGPLASAEQDRIHLVGLTFEGRHGWHEAERRRLRPFRVDLSVALPLGRAAATDELSDTLDYNALAETVQRVVTQNSFRLIERLAGALAEALLHEHPIEAVQVTVHKPSPGVAGEPTSAAVTLCRRRSR
ncbi:MAG: dihydroneopterin aldolase [Deltaproteobacteria bacterium]|nr:MAG: dihydroneopterin aldolase [Deltaproteobacteria bacterium]